MKLNKITLALLALGIGLGGNVQAATDAERIAQLAILDTMFICLAREDYETAERNLNKVLTSVAVYSTNDRGRTERRGTPRADKNSPDGVQPAKETARKRVEL